MFLVDSSGWIEFFTDGQFAERYAKYIKTPSRIITPTVVLYEVYKKIKKERTEEEALIAVSHMNKTRIIELRESIALFAADISLKYALPMADAIVYATAVEEHCRVVTGDAHFRDLENVIFVS